MLGLALAYGWVSFPYTLFPLMTNGNDTLIAMFLVYALLALTSTPARGALIALAGAAKFAPLALAPLFATGRGDGSRLRSWTSFSMVFALVMLVAVVPHIPADGGLGVLWSQTIGFQLDRESPFSVWGQNSGLEPLLWLVKVAVVGLAVAVAFVPRRRDTLQVAALGAAVLIATQLLAIHWFYLYIVLVRPVRCSWRCSVSTRTAQDASACPIAATVRDGSRCRSSATAQQAGVPSRRAAP